MIKHNQKKCKIDGCQNLLYARGYCIYHYRSEYLYPRKQEKSIIRRVIPRRTVKRLEGEKLYSHNRNLFIQAERAKNKGKVYCIFCGKEITSEPSLHHGLGRDNDKLLDERYWFLSHNYCHVHVYHSQGWKSIPWWNEYLERIKSIPEIYQKELQRMERSKLKK